MDRQANIEKSIAYLAADEQDRCRIPSSPGERQRLLLLEFGVGFNTPVIIRMPFERMAAQLPDTTLVRFNRDYPQPYQAGIERFIPFTEDINRIISQLNIST